MFKLDGSQTAWLIYADWLEDQDLPANFIRELSKSIEDSWWYSEFPSGGLVGNFADYEAESSPDGPYTTFNYVGSVSTGGVGFRFPLQFCGVGSETFEWIGDF